MPDSSTSEKRRREATCKEAERDRTVNPLAPTKVRRPAAHLGLTDVASARLAWFAAGSHLGAASFR